MERFVLWHRILPLAFEEEETTAAAAQWARHVTREVQEAGGEVISSLAGTVVANFSLHELRTAINLALRLLAEAESRPVPAGGVPIAFGIATGDVQRARDESGRATNTGSAIDRAQLLANQGRAGEVVLDVESREAASSTYLFGRSVATASFALRGETIDRRRPFLHQCREGVAALEPAPVPATIRHTLEPVKKAAASGRTHTFFLHAPLGSGARAAILRLRDELRPPAFFEIGAVPGGLEPLGGLRLALLNSWRSPERLRLAIEATDKDAGDALEAIATGDPPPRSRAVAAMRLMLRLLRTQRGVPWFYVDRVSAVDPATLSVLVEVLEAEDVSALTCIRVTEPDVPAGLQTLSDPKGISLPSLEVNEALVIASGILGQETPTDIAKQVVVAGGASVLGLTEAARTMVASGDVVRQGTRFVWRRIPRDRRQFMGPRALLEERLAALGASSTRYLEVACAILPASASQVVDAAVALDGLDAETRKQALDELIADRFLTVVAKPTSEVLRRAVIQRMPPARRSEVYRFAARALREAEPFFGPAMSATIGAYLCEGGDLAQGVRQLLNSGALAARHGYTTAAVRLAAAAVQYQPDPSTRLEASEISRSVRGSSLPPDYDEDEDRPTIPIYERKVPLTDQVTEALRIRDHGRFDELIESAIAAGADLTGAHCLRVLSFITRGDIAGAQDALEAARRSPLQQSGSTTRIGIASAALLLARSRPRDAMIAALEALAAARALEDAAGEAASLKLVAATCLAVGEPDDAERLEQLAS